MKKICLILGLLFGAGVLVTPVSAESVCSQVVTAAVNYRGECQYFANPCQVPADMKKVPSCDLVETSDGVSLEEKNEMRRQAYFRTKPAENNQLASITYEKRATNYRGFGSGTLTRGNVNRSGVLEAKNTRKFSNNLVRSSYYTKTAGGDESTNLRSGMFRRAARASGPERTGVFENKPKWSVQQQRHAAELPTDFANKPWESEVQTRIKEYQARKRAERAAYRQSVEDSDGMSELRQGGYRESSIGELERYIERE